jgi:hypothetical protein
LHHALQFHLCFLCNSWYLLGLSGSYACGTCSLIPWQKFGLTKFVSKVTKITGGWRKIHIEELHNLCSSPVIVGWDGRNM